MVSEPSPHSGGSDQPDELRLRMHDPRVIDARGRLIDAGALDDWQRRAEQLRAQGFAVTVSTWLEQTATREQLRAGFDLADIVLSEWRGYPPSWDEHLAETPVALPLAG